MLRKKKPLLSTELYIVIIYYRGRKLTSAMSCSVALNGSPRI